VALFHSNAQGQACLGIGLELLTVSTAPQGRAALLDTANANFSLPASGNICPDNATNTTSATISLVFALTAANADYKSLSGALVLTFTPNLAGNGVGWGSRMWMWMTSWDLTIPSSPTQTWTRGVWRVRS
jgi:hypothetical protein